MDQYPYFAAQPQQNSFSLYGLPTPTQNAQGDDIQGEFDLNYPPFDPSFNPVAHPHAQAQAQHFGGGGHPPQSPPDSYTKQSVSSGEHSSGSGNVNNQYQHQGQGLNDLDSRSSSEEKDGRILDGGLGIGGAATPTQSSKRKEQNRAAQRAFRERKERHVRDLEEKVSNLKQESSTLQADNERLQREIARYSTENEILRATSTSNTSRSSPHPNTSHNSRTARRSDADREENETETGPMIYSPTDFYSDLVPKGQLARLHRVTYCKVTGERLLDAGATWELIQGHEMFKKGVMDLAAVTAKLKGAAQCNGQGPAFRECQVREAIEASVMEGADGLL
ncbi:hypothetical protein BDV18DRAFT_91116 [Aspergillus unguis]